MTEVPGSPFGQYQLIEKIAQGGMAEIFRGKALDASGIEKPVVIKRILPQIAASPEFVEMLIDEAKIAVMLSHGNIAQIYDLGKVADDYFIVMEYVDGKTLSQIMKRLRTLNKKMPVAFAVWLCAEIASGLDYMHRKKDEGGNPLHIVHRDISPQNIILSTSGTVKIIDFGIAKAKTKISTTDSGVLKGKFAYMSPEHAEGEKLDHRTDIFSLGIILFELLTGQRLFKGKNNPETIRRVKRSKVPLPSTLREKVGKELDRIVLKALQKKREERYSSADAFHGELTRYLVTHHPDFNPRELSNYLAELFPEVAQKLPEAQPVLTETKKTPGQPHEDHDETIGASSEVIRRNLEAEELEKPPIEAGEEKTSRLKLRPLVRPTAYLLSTLFLIATGIKIGPTVTRWFKDQLLPRAAELRTTLLSPTKTAEQPPPSAELQPPKAPEPAPPQGSLALNSQPPDATIFLNDQETEWRTPALLSFEPGKEQKIGLYLDRYRFWEGRFKMDPGKTISLSIPLELNFGDLEVSSLPPQAALYLNGKKVGQTPYSLSGLAPETTYEIVLKKEGYEEWRREIKIFGGKSEVINASLKKLPKIKPLP